MKGQPQWAQSLCSEFPVRLKGSESSDGEEERPKAGNCPNKVCIKVVHAGQH